MPSPNDGWKYHWPYNILGFAVITTSTRIETLPKAKSSAVNA
jgi:hypothetical protein